MAAIKEKLMKKAWSILAIVLATSLLAHTAQAKSVRGYVKKDGTYVAPHQTTTPNDTTRDNWSTKGNVNPYTGKAGTK